MRWSRGNFPQLVRCSYAEKVRSDSGGGASFDFLRRSENKLQFQYQIPLVYRLFCAKKIPNLSRLDFRLHNKISKCIIACKILCRSSKGFRASLFRGGVFVAQAKI